MERVIFLDRDGTLNEEVNYLHRKEDLKILDGVPEALRMFKEHGYKLVVVTNQAGVARGYYGESDVEELHRYMNGLLKPLGAEIDAFYYCPHHPEHGIGEYKAVCRCRKPETEMFERAEREFPVDKAASWMIGDKLIDVEAGKNYGVKTVLVGTGYGAGIHAKLTADLQGQAKEGVRNERAAETAIPEKEGAMPYDIYAETLADAARAITGT